MTELQKLHAAILAEPDDNLARLAYADECEAVGLIERANYIRTEVAIAMEGRKQNPDRAEIARLVKLRTEPPRDWDPRYSPRYQDWFAYSSTARAPFKWSRGFIVGAETLQERWIRYGPLLIVDWPIAKVRIECAQPNSHEGNYSWVRILPDDYFYREYLKPELYNCLDGFAGERATKQFGAQRWHRYYATKQAALDALNRAALLWAKCKAKIDAAVQPVSGARHEN